jgi:hypothetical protein
VDYSRFLQTLGLQATRTASHSRQRPNGLGSDIGVGRERCGGRLQRECGDVGETGVGVGNLMEEYRI